MLPGRFLMRVSISMTGRKYARRLLPSGASDPDLAQCFANLNSYGIEFTLETGITGPFTSGEDAFDFNRVFWNRFIGLGAPLTTFYLQEPLTSGLEHTSLTYGQLVQETADWIALVRQNYPGMKLILMEAYPYNSPSETLDFIDDVNAAAASLSVDGLDGYELDLDINASGWSWSGVSTIRSEVHSRSMEFHAILWGGGSTGSNCDYVQNTLDQALGMISNGLTADTYSIQSWDVYPTVTLPEPYAPAVQCTFLAAAAFFVFDPYLYDAYGHSVSLLAHDGTHYVVAEGNGNDVVDADRTSIGSWETWKLLDLNGGSLHDGDSVALVTSAGWNFYAQDNGAMLATGTGIPIQREIFTIVNVDHPGNGIGNGDKIALQSYDGYYACAERGGGDTVNVNRTSIGVWETFTLIIH